MTKKEIETWLSDSRVGSNSVVDHRSRRPVLSALRNCVDRCQVWPRCKPWTWKQASSDNVTRHSLGMQICPDFYITPNSIIK